MKLKGRLRAIAEMVPKCNLICDIGTDHAYIPIYLVKSSICKRAIITDIKQGPINIAENNIRENHLEDCIETRLGDGLHPLDNNEIDVLIIAGMGGKLMAKILWEGISKAMNANLLILQAMNGLELVTQWLFEEGFDICDEELVEDDNRIYNIKAARWTGVKKVYNNVDLHISKKLIEKNNPLLIEYIDRKLAVLDKIISGLQKTNKNSAEAETELYKMEILKKDMTEIINNMR
ncbi:MAG TPA: class I SAM-dependent methyltransferase [Clostridiales bacterium]|nr:class I SAM-dependent methyltransferase [Clostridiales bacterium]